MKPRPLEDVVRDMVEAIDYHRPEDQPEIYALQAELREALAEREKNPVPLAHMIEALDQKVSLLVDNVQMMMQPMVLAPDVEIDVERLKPGQIDIEALNRTMDRLVVKTFMEEEERLP